MKPPARTLGLRVQLGDLVPPSQLPRPGCWRKQRWASKGAAEAQLRSLLRNPHVQDADRLNAYHCGCGGWHVGRLRPGQEAPRG